MARKSNPKPPSRVRYEQENPTISFRLPKELHEELRQLLRDSNRSFADLARGLLEAQKPDWSRAHERGYEDGFGEGWQEGLKKGYAVGYDKAKKLYRVTYKCAICGEELEIDTPKEKSAAARYLRNDNWGHADCHKRT